MSKEHGEQKAIVEYLRLKKILVIQTDVMSGLQFFSHKDSRRFTFIAHHKNMGYEKGQSDLILIIPVKTIFVEVKTLKGYQSASQIKFQKNVESLGHDYFIWRSLDDCIKWYEAYKNGLYK